MTAFLASLMFVVLAEMGDKTQLLAMCFALRYRWQTVMWAVFWATAANHLLAATAGGYLTGIIPLEYIKIAAAAAFIIFGLWTIKGDTLRCDPAQSRFGPFWTVAIAFFMAEMGDKTQLATVTLAAHYHTIIPVWLGTTAGMMVADAIGIVVGVVSGRKIPERLVKWCAALIFIAFGIFGLYESLPGHIWTAPVVLGGAAALGLLIYGVNRMNKHAEVRAETGEAAGSEAARTGETK